MVVLIAALEQEVDPILYEKFGKNVIQISGIGKIRAAAKTAEVLREVPCGPKTIVLNFGTCGSGKHKVGEIISIEKVYNAGNSMIDECMLADVQIGTKTGLLRTADQFISTKYMSEEEVNAIKADFDCMDMEGAAICKVAHTLGCRFASIKIVSDDMTTTIDDWDAQVKRLTRPLAERVIKFCELATNFKLQKV